MQSADVHVVLRGLLRHIADRRQGSGELVDPWRVVGAELRGKEQWVSCPVSRCECA